MDTDQPVAASPRAMVSAHSSATAGGAWAAPRLAGAPLRISPESRSASTSSGVQFRRQLAQPLVVEGGGLRLEAEAFRCLPETLVAGGGK